MSVLIIDTIKKLVDSQTAKIELHTNNGRTVHLNCIYKESQAPNFFLVFPPRTLPDNIDTGSNCPVSIKSGASNETLSARIVEIKGDRTLELTAQSTVTPESLREYFRVSIKASITAKYEPQSDDSAISTWTLVGRTLDMSGSGTLAIFDEDPKSKQKLSLAISLLEDQEDIHCRGHIVRSKRIRKGRFQVSFHFDYISAQDKDAIISFCLQEQRNQLRDKIQTAG